MEDTSKIPRLLASTGDTYCCSIADSRIRERKLREQDGASTQNEGETIRGIAAETGSENGADTAAETPRFRNEDDLEVNYFKSAQW